MRWPPFQHVFFDCDSTLTTVEGIDVLAEQAGKGWRVKVLTEAAMNGQRDLEEVYGRRLAAIKPRRGQVLALRQVYKSHVVPEAAAVIQALQALGHQVYIISGGLLEPVQQFGLYLGVPREHIRAVELEYNQLAGDWWLAPPEQGVHSADHYLAHQQDGLSESAGKAKIIRQLLGEQRGRALLVGDGVSDLRASQVVDLFAGFGGVVTRPAVLQHAPVFLHGPSLAPVLALAAGPAAIDRLAHTPHQAVFAQALEGIAKGAVSFQDESLRERFTSAYQAVYPRPH